MMPRGGRRGRFWQRFHRDDEGIPPPPPPPNIDHLRWSYPSPVRRGRRTVRPWLVEGSLSDGSSSRWALHHDPYYYDEEERESHSGEICIICGDLVGNHTDMPSLHLCNNSGYEYVPASTSHRVAYGRRSARRDHDPPGVAYQHNYQDQQVYGAGAAAASGGAGAGGGDENRIDEQELAWLINKLQRSQICLENTNLEMKELCHQLRSNNPDEKSSPKEEDSFSEALVGGLQTDLEDQYRRFLDHVRLQIQERSTVLESEKKRIQREKHSLGTKMFEVEGREKLLDTKEKEINEMRLRVEMERAQLLKDSETERAEIRRQWQKLKDEVTRMEEMHKLQDSRVKLDVGGVKFTTSTSTLTRDQDSMLAAMFSGRHQIKYEEDGTIFMDRDGTHFRYILNYLRDGATEGSLPESQQELKELLNEAVYYQIAGLVEAIEEKLQ